LAVKVERHQHCSFNKKLVIHACLCVNVVFIIRCLEEHCGWSSAIWRKVANSYRSKHTAEVTAWFFFPSCVIKCSLQFDLGVGRRRHKLHTILMEDFYFCWRIGRYCEELLLLWDMGKRGKNRFL